MGRMSRDEDCGGCQSSVTTGDESREGDKSMQSWGGEFDEENEHFRFGYCTERYSMALVEDSEFGLHVDQLKVEAAYGVYKITRQSYLNSSRTRRDSRGRSQGGTLFVGGCRVFLFALFSTSGQSLVLLPFIAARPRQKALLTPGVA